MAGSSAKYFCCLLTLLASQPSKAHRTFASKTVHVIDACTAVLTRAAGTFIYVCNMKQIKGLDTILVTTQNNEPEVMLIYYLKGQKKTTQAIRKEA